MFKFNLKNATLLNLLKENFASLWFHRARKISLYTLIITFIDTEFALKINMLNKL
jgi:hypothetical protein